MNDPTFFFSYIYHVLGGNIKENSMKITEGNW